MAKTSKNILFAFKGQISMRHPGLDSSEVRLNAIVKSTEINEFNKMMTKILKRDWEVLTSIVYEISN